MGIEDPRKTKEGLRIKFKEVDSETTFSLPRFKDYRRFLVWKKTGDNQATWQGFRVEYQEAGITSRVLMQHQGQTEEVGADEEVEIG